MRIETSTAIRCMNVQIEPLGVNTIEVTIQEFSHEDLLDNIKPNEAVAYYGDDTLLDIIGEEAARKYFRIESNE